MSWTWKGQHRNNLITFTTDTGNPLHWIILPHPWTKPWGRSFGSSGHLQAKQTALHLIESILCSFIWFTISPHPRLWSNSGSQECVLGTGWLFSVLFCLPALLTSCGSFRAEGGEGRSSGDLPPWYSVRWAMPALAGCLWFLPQSLCMWLTPHRFFSLEFPTSDRWFFNRFLSGQRKSSSPPWCPLQLDKSGKYQSP